MKFGDRVLLKQYKNGNKLFGTVTRCMKCSGSGKVIWSYADHVCFDCNGKGWYFEKETEYTPENLAKREAKLAKKREQFERERAEREAEQAKREAEWKAVHEEMMRIRRGHYFGTVGEKIEIEVTYTGCSSFETLYGWMNVYRFDTDDGAHLVWKSSADLGGTERMVLEGDRIKIRATIKDHKEYKEIEQTELTRVKVVDGGSLWCELTREELETATKLEHDYGWSSEEHLTYLRNVQNSRQH